MKITLKEIAEKTSLSVSALSRVASGNGYVSAGMRAQAEAALEAFGYRRSLPLSGKCAQTKDIILVIAGSTGDAYQEVIRSLTTCARKTSKHVLSANTQYDSSLEEEYLRFAQHMGVYGIVLLSVPEKNSTLQLIRQCEIPFVFVGRYLSALQADTVTQDSYEMGALAAKALIAAGHTHIAYLGGHAESSITRDKQLGFTDHLREAGLTLDERLIAYGRLDYQSGANYANALLHMEHPPTAVFVSNDLMAIGMIDILRRAGVRVPEDLSLICCDRTPASDTYPIALDRLAVSKIGDYAPAVMRLLDARRKNPSRPRSVIMFEPRHLPGETISAPRNRVSLLP